MAFKLNITAIPDPDCSRCDGVCWYEGGETIQTVCECLRIVTKQDAEDYVSNGTHEDWRALYDMAMR